MDPLTEGLMLANTIARIEEQYLLGLNDAQKAARSTHIFDLIEHVLSVADKAHAILHPNDVPAAGTA